MTAMNVYSETENISSKKEICLNHEVFCKNYAVLCIILTTPYIALYVVLGVTKMLSY